MTQEILPTWGILELEGGERLPGFIHEAQVAGVTFLRIDIPTGEHERHPAGRVYSDDEFLADPTIHYYSVYSVRSLIPTGEDSARAAAEKMRLHLLHPISLEGSTIPQDYRAYLSYRTQRDSAAAAEGERRRLADANNQ